MPEVVVEPPESNPDGSTLPLFAGRQGLLLLAAAGVYAAGFFLWFPRGLSITDEAHYVSGALALARAVSTGSLEGFTAASIAGVAPVTYPAGTAMLEAPFVLLFGWHAAALASVLCVWLVAAVLWFWLKEGGQTPSFAWLWLGFPPVLVMGRLAMSDVPAAACAVVGLYAFWKGSQEGATFRPWLAAGLATGGSLLFREPLLLILGPFAAGALLRRERYWHILTAGLLIGGIARLVAGRVFYGDPLTYNPVSATFSLHAILETGHIYVLLLLVGVPGALVWMPRYRGWRWQECQIAVWSTVVFFLCYGYSAHPSGTLRQMVLLGRFLVPVVPLLAWCASSTLGEWWSRRQQRPEATAEAWIPWSWVGAVFGGVLLVHPVLATWDEAQARITDRITAVLPDHVQVVAVAADIARHVHAGTGRRTLLSYEIARPHELSRPGVRRPPVYVVSVERSTGDSADEELAQLAQTYRAELAGWCTVTPVVEEEIDPGTRLRVHRITECTSPVGHAPVSP